MKKEIRNQEAPVKSQKKLFSLRKQISRLLIGFCVLVMTFWFTGIAVSIRSWQKEQDADRIASLESYAETLDNGIMQLNDVIGTIFSTNSAFIGIDQFRTAAEEAEYTYELLNLLRIQVKSNKNIAGMFLLYKNLEKVCIM